MRTRDRLVGWGSAVSLLAATGLAVAQPEATKPAERPRAERAAQPEGQGQDILYIYSAGLEGMMTSPKDAGLREALRLVRPRLIELVEMQTQMHGAPAEAPDPEQAINTFWTLLESPLTVRLAMTEGGEEGAPPIAALITSRPENPAAFERDLVAMIRDTNGPRMRVIDGGRELDTPGGPARLLADEESVSLSFGGELGGFERDWGLPRGYETVFAMHANLQNAQPLIEMALSGADEGAQEVRPMLEQAGVLGEGALVFDVAMGTNGSEALTRGTFHGMRAHAEAMGIPGDVSLDREFLSLIPGDATYVTAGVFDLGFMKQMLQMPEVQEGLAQVNEQLGIDLEDDVINQIGQRALLYQSDRTGGGGILSTIVVLELADGEQFGRAHRRLVAAANDAAAEAIPAMTQGLGGVEITSRRSEGVEFFTLTFPGLPIPAEISWTIHGDHLMLALSPRSLVEAMSQAGGEGGSFADNAMLREMAGQAGDGLISVQYTDAPRFARQGYWLVNALCAGASNAVRTTDGADPGIPLPAFNDFIEGIEPTMMVSYWDGDDMRISGRSDASVLVGLAGSSGAILGPLAIATAAGAVLPAMGEARSAARETVSMSHLRQISMAMVMYSADNQDKVPESIGEIGDYLGFELSSPVGPSSDGGPDYAIRTDLGGTRMGRMDDPSTTLAAIDRASVVNGNEKVFVAFFDGHVESIFSWQLTDLLAQEQNRGAFEAFGLPDWLNPGF